MPAIGILAKLKGLFGGKGSELVKELGTGLDNLFTSKEEKAILENKKIEIENLLQEKVLAHEVRMEELAIERVKIELESDKAYLADVQDARGNNTRIQDSERASWLSKNMLYLLAGLVTLGFFGLLAYLFKHEVPEENKDILNIMLGSLGTAWITIIAFFFGSSMGSKNSGDLVRKIASNK